MSVATAAKSGDQYETLAAMRDRVATAIDDETTPARDLAALTRRLLEITKALEALDAEESEDAEDAPTPDEAFDAETI